MKNTRQQLTLFLEKEDAAPIEKIRKKYNPKQYKIIPAHITLCREDEIEYIASIQKNLEHLKMEAFDLELTEVTRFSEGKGVLIKVRDKQEYFKNLRALILQHTSSQPRLHSPHITLMHPRNSTCTDLIFEEIKTIKLPEKIRITKITLIEQEIGKEWKALKEYQLM